MREGAPHRTFRHLGPPSSPSLCCLAASDVWACREVPEWALERGHSLPVQAALTDM